MMMLGLEKPHICLVARMKILGVLPKHHRTARGEPTHGKKKTVRCILLTMIIPKETVVQLGANVLAIVLQSGPIQESVLTDTLHVTTIPNGAAFNSLVRTDEPPSKPR